MIKAVEDHLEKTKKRVIRRVTCVPSLDHADISHFPEEKECATLDLDLDNMVTAIGSVDQQNTGARKEGNTFIVECECDHTDPVFLERPFQSMLHVPDGGAAEGCSTGFECYAITSPPVRITGECGVQQRHAEGTSNLDVPSNFIDKGKRKMYEVSNESQFVPERPSSTLSSKANDAELLCEESILIMHDEMSGVIPGHVPGPYASQAPGHSSNEDPQTFAAIPPPCNLNVQTDGQVQPCQVTMSDDQCRTRNRSRRGNQDPQTSARIPPPCNLRCVLRQIIDVFHVACLEEADKVLWIHTYIWAGVIRFVGIAMQDFDMTKGFRPVPGTVLITINVATMEKSCQGLRPDIVENLIELLDEHNELVQLFRTARDKMAERDVPEFKVRLFGVVGSRQHELPTGDSIGANFPLIFFFGEDGYHLGRVLLSRPSSSDPPKKMTMKMYYQYELHDHNEVANRLEHFQRSCQGLRPDIVENLIELLDEHNELVQLFRTARDKMAERDVPEFKVRLFGVVGSRQHELPTGDSIGANVFEGGSDVETEFDVIVEQHDHRLQQAFIIRPSQNNDDEDVLSIRAA
ncbi:hypothetical protein CTI12_AA159020 [Artemisia annua]|uniref:Helitron helicase-like domain-containing protein n=1 Tax=Artemisia annua TaxID=35608 RepID=A0A2U1PEW3_ARTAN|nr:hypothetical protein CTI12_AA159020 [Artemisia annua]